MIRLKSGKRVIDIHAHFWANRPSSAATHVPHPMHVEYNRERSQRMFDEWDFPGPPEPMVNTPEGEEQLIDRWAAEVDRYELEAVVFLTGSSNEELARVIKRHPGRFYGFAHHRPELADAAEKLRYGVEELGLSGYKLLGPRVSIDWTDPQLKPLWRYMADRQLPLLVHFGPLGRAGGVVWHKHMNPLTITPIAMEYPEIPIIVPHFGCGYMRELLQLCWACPNIYVDTSGSNQWMRWEPYPMDLDTAFRKFYETIGPKRILFGTDSMWFPRGFVYRYLQDQMRAVRYLNFHEEDIEDIFHNNAARLLKLEG